MYCVKENNGVYIYCFLLFPFFYFFHLSLQCNAYENFPSKISQELLDLGFLNLVQGFGMTSCTV